MSHSQQPRIVIVGAGIAGLNAALTLQDAGFASTIYEASDHVGGRMHSDTTTWADGVVSELCGEFIDSDHKTLHSLVKRFGLQLIHMGNYIADNAQTTMYYNNRYYDGHAFKRDFSILAPTLQQQYEKAGFPTNYTHFTEAAYELDQMSVYDWVAQHVEGGHAAPLGHLLNRGCSGFYGLDTHQQSALNLIYMYGPQAANSSFMLSGPMKGSTRIEGGNQRLPHAIAASLPENSVQLNSSLIAIGRNGDNTIDLSFMTPRGLASVQCDAVILTLPFSTLRLVDYGHAGFDPLKGTTIAELGYGTISKLFLEFDTRYWFGKGPWPGVNNGFIMTDMNMQVLWDTSVGQAGKTGVLVDYTGGVIGAAYAPESAYSTTDDSERIQHYARTCLEQLEQIFPGISAHYTGKAALSYPTGDPYLLGSYSCWKIGQYTRFAGYERVRQGPIHFAGEHCSTDWQGFMEGAAEEGARAAGEIVQDYKH